MRTLLVSAMIVLTVSGAMAAERVPIPSIDSDALTADTQVQYTGVGDDHFAFAWWIPFEFWQALMARDATTSDVDKNSILEVMSNISLLAVVQADVTTFGAFEYYSKERVNTELTVTFTGAGNNRQRLTPLEAIDPDLEIMLGVFKPILVAAMGSLGENFHFFVLNDQSKSSGRIVDPYRTGRLTIGLAVKNVGPITADIETPLNALFVPRKCPNGKDAHISWKYCPWSGVQLGN